MNQKKFSLADPFVIAYLDLEFGLGVYVQLDSVVYVYSSCHIFFYFHSLRMICQS